MKLLIMDQAKNTVMIDNDDIVNEIVLKYIHGQFLIHRNKNKTELAQRVDRFLKGECEYDD